MERTHAAVNGVLAAFWSTAALANWLPDFRRMPSKANVSDAVSRENLETTPVQSILRTLAAVTDFDFAENTTADELVNLAV